MSIPFTFLPVMAMIVSLFSFHVLADEPPLKPVEVTGRAKLGFLYSQANETSSSLNTGFNLGYKYPHYSHEMRVGTFYTKSSDADDGANKYALGYKFSYDLNQNNAAFLSNDYFHSQFQTYRQVYSLTSGLEYRFFDTKKAHLKVGGGPGYRFTERQSDDDEYPNQREHEIIANLFLQANVKVTESFSFGGEGSIDYGESNTTYVLASNITNKLINNVALAFDTKYIYNTDVASDDSNDELFSSVNLTYSF